MGARLRGRTATQRSKKGSERVLGKGSGEGFWGRVLRRVLKRGLAVGFAVKRVLRRVLRRGSEKGVSRRCPERPLEEYAPLGVRPTQGRKPRKRQGEERFSKSGLRYLDSKRLYCRTPEK